MRARIVTILALLAVGLLALAAPAGADWTAYHEGGALNAADHTSGRAARLKAAWKVTNLHGAVWSEPLVYRGLVIIATEANDVYAFRARTGARVWHARLGAPVPASALPCGDISPTLGITGTPVIDRRTGTLYAVADRRSGASARHMLFALNARTGRRRFTRSVEPPSIPLNQLQRESLALAGGRILIGYGGNDGDCAQYRGFLVSAPANGRGADAIYAVPTSREGAIWSGGGSPAVDTTGNVFVPTGNAADGPGQSFDHGDTLEKLSPLGSQLDYWAPASWARDSAADADLGSVSPELLPGHLAYQGGKNGQGYLVSTRHLGHIGGELFSAPVCTSFGSDAYSAGTLFVACTEGIHALTVKLAAHRFAARWAGPSDADGPPILAAGRVWVTSTSDSLLYGLDPRTGAVRARLSTPAMEHFSTPAASGGRLFLATRSDAQRVPDRHRRRAPPVSDAEPAPVSDAEPAPVSDTEPAPALTLDHVQLAAPSGCEVGARRFYGELLGLTEIEKPAGLRARGGVWFALSDGRQLHVRVEARFLAATKAHPALAAADAQALHRLADRLSEAGVPVDWDDALCDVVRFYTADPFGNRLELLAPAG